MWKQKIKTSQYWSLVYTTVYTIHAGVLETITIDGVYGSFTTNSDGTVNHALPLGELTLTGSISGQSFTRTVTKDTTDVYVMPEGALYWYWNYVKQMDIANSIWSNNGNYYNMPITNSTNSFSFSVKRPDYNYNYSNALLTKDSIDINNYQSFNAIVNNSSVVDGNYILLVASEDKTSLTIYKIIGSTDSETKYTWDISGLINKVIYGGVGYVLGSGITTLSATFSAIWLE